SSFMSDLFSSEPGMRKRFYRSAATQLASKLRQLGQERKPKAPQVEESKGRNQISDSDKEVTAEFGLPRGEVLVTGKPSVTNFKQTVCTCWVKGIIKEHGRLYIMKHFLCFESKVFGKKTKVC